MMYGKPESNFSKKLASKVLSEPSLSNKKEINILYAELGHPSEVITYATGRAMGLQKQLWENEKGLHQ